jgi:hypothetical protein
MGVIENVLVLKGKGQAFIEMQNVQEAATIVSTFPNIPFKLVLPLSPLSRFHFVSLSLGEALFAFSIRITKLLPFPK